MQGRETAFHIQYFQPATAVVKLGEIILQSGSAGVQIGRQAGGHAVREADFGQATFTVGVISDRELVDRPDQLVVQTFDRGLDATQRIIDLVLGGGAPIDPITVVFQQSQQQARVDRILQGDAQDDVGAGL